jgi:hypothetical protein
MTLRVPRLPFPFDPLIAEAKRRMRRRRLLVAVAVLGIVGAIAAAGVISARSPAGAYTSIPWTRGQSTQVRYCQRPDNAGAFLAASAGVTCQAATAVQSALTSRCYARGRCTVDLFRCVVYYDGTYGGTFDVYHHALCANRSRRVVWDGG